MGQSKSMILIKNREIKFLQEIVRSPDRDEKNIFTEVSSNRSITPFSMLEDCSESPFIDSPINSNPKNKKEKITVIEPIIDINEIYNSYEIQHPEDFVLKRNLLPNITLFHHGDYSLMSNRECAILYSGAFKSITLYSEMNGYLPTIPTITIQLIIRFLEKKIVDKYSFKCLVAISYKFAVQLEYENSNFEDIRDVVTTFKSMKLQKTDLINMEKAIMLSLKGDLIKDTIYHWFTVDERKRIIKEKSLRDSYYLFISNLDMYTVPSKSNAQLFRTIYFTN